MAIPFPRHDVWWADQVSPPAHPTAASGWADLDAVLPGGGWPLGAVAELSLVGSHLPWRLMQPALQQAATQGRIALIELPLEPNAHAWAAQGVPPERLLRVTCTRDADALWAAEQVLRCPEVALCWVHWKRPQATAVRRLQLAANAAKRDATLPGSWPAPLVLSSQDADLALASSAAPLRLDVTAGDLNGFAVRLRKRRGPPLSGPIQLDAPLPLRRLVGAPSDLCPALHDNPAVDRVPARLALASA